MVIIENENRKKVKLAFVERREERRKELIEITNCSALFEVCCICKNESELMRQISNVHPDVIALNSTALCGFLEHCDESIATVLKLQKEGTEKLKKIIRRKLLDVRIPTRILAFSYIADAILFIMENEGKDCSIVKDVYPHIAKKYKVSACSVESAIRKALSRTYDEQMKENECKLPIDGETNRVASNGKFLTQMAKIISLEC